MEIPTQNPPKPFPAWRLINGVKNASDLNLESAEFSCEKWAWGCGALVVVGVVLETALAIFHPTYDSPWERWGGSVGNSLVVIGVAGEILFSRMGFTRTNELTRRSSEKVGVANKIAAQAIKDAAEARERTAEIEKLTAWRKVSPDMHGRILKALRNKAHMIDLAVEYERGDPEAFSFARDLAQAFANAGVSNIRVGPNSFLDGNRFGYAIWLGESSDGETISDILFDVFAIKCEASDLRFVFGDEAAAPNLYIFVAPKPPPPLIVNAVGTANGSSTATGVKPALRESSI